MTFGEKAFNALANARTKAGGVLPKEVWIQTVDDLVALEAVFKKRKPSSKRPAEGRPRNVLFDALAIATGTRDLTKLSRIGGRTVGIALADIIDVEPELTVEKIESVVRSYKARHPTWPCTAMAIAKHWAEFAKTAPTNASKRDVYVEPTVPWREVAAHIFPDAKDWIDPHDFATKAWLEIADTCRSKILAAVYP